MQRNAEINKLLSSSSSTSAILPAGVLVLIIVYWYKTGYNNTMWRDPRPPIRSIQPVVTIVSIHDQPSDFAYWQSQPYSARLAALEEIRTEYHQWKYGYEPGFQRIYSIVKR
jgi:hypothetical protein